jgi:hypothetical protein
MLMDSQRMQSVHSNVSWALWDYTMRGIGFVQVSGSTGLATVCSMRHRLRPLGARSCCLFCCIEGKAHGHNADSSGVAQHQKRLHNSRHAGAHRQTRHIKQRQQWANRAVCWFVCLYAYLFVQLTTRVHTIAGYSAVSISEPAEFCCNYMLHWHIIHILSQARGQCLRFSSVPAVRRQTAAVKRHILTGCDILTGCGESGS